MNKAFIFLLLLSQVVISSIIGLTVANPIIATTDQDFSSQNVCAMNTDTAGANLNPHDTEYLVSFYVVDASYHFKEEL
ncbi:MAG: hypothetical protein FWG20_06770 [Candidatus Cloacimonetes bacterium]|nr:hypothetical protein [Candidatus Cloacimonadota bacterium]